MDPLGLQKTVDELTGKVAALETQTARDVNAIVDKVLAAVLPEVKAIRESITTGVAVATASIDTITLTINASVTETLALARRLDGATLKLGPE